VRLIYLAATGQNRGKTTAALGLLDGFIARGHETGFLKPVGQRTQLEDGAPADEDAILMRRVFGLPDSMRVMSPVHIPRGFTKAYISGEVVEDLGQRILQARDALDGRDIVLVEGTGHAGVGAVVGLSNAVVAAMLDAPAVIVSEGGVGRPIDELVLNASHFAAHGVEVAGAIVNKVRLDAQPDLAAYLEKGLARHGIPLLGVLPFRPILSNPTLAMVLESVHGETLCAGPDLDRVIDDISIASMGPGHVLERVGPGTLVIVSGDREDVILAISATHSLNANNGHRMNGNGSRGSSTGPAGAGLVLTGGYHPQPRIVEAIRQANLFATLVDSDTYSTASRIHDLLVKTHPSDVGKIELIKALVAEHLDVDRILAVARPPRA
jgi:BioD-like phosphotransacetylase family protein